MGYYAIGVCDLFEGRNEVMLVIAESPREALIDVLDLGDEEYIDDMDVEDILQHAFDGDLYVSEPVAIQE